MKSRHIFILFALVFLIGGKLKAEGSREGDSLALVAIYNVAGNPQEWKWSYDKPLEKWPDVKLSAGRVVELNFNGYFEIDTLPPEIGDLTELRKLRIVNCTLKGTLPSAIGKLSNLEYLDLNYNHSLQRLPVEIWNCTKLKYLDVRDTEAGQLHSEMGKCVLLEKLIMSNSLLRDTIPAEIGNLKLLVELELSDNAMKGTIPAEIGNLDKLAILDLSNNQLTGNIPSTIGNFKELKVLYLGQNSLSGGIPETIGDLPNVTEVLLNGNNLTGLIPLSICNIDSLKKLNLGDNKLSGEIPSELGNLGHLFVLHLNNNMLTGTIPDALGNLSDMGNPGEKVYHKVNGLDLSDNMLTGFIPVSFRNFNKNRGVVNLDNNFLEGGLENITVCDEYYITERISINNNKFAFEDFELMDMETLHVADFIYEPQDSVQIEANIRHGLLRFDIHTGGTQNHYQWFENDVPIGNDHARLELQDLTTDLSTIRCEITNDAAPLLTLHTRPATTITGVEDDEETLSLVLSPNPASTEIRIESEDPVEEATVYDMKGNCYEIEATGQNGYDVSKLQRGAYTLVFKTVGGRGARKFVKE